MPFLPCDAGYQTSFNFKFRLLSWNFKRLHENKAYFQETFSGFLITGRTINQKRTPCDEIQKGLESK